MIEVTRFLKEWNAVIEALGRGYQTILIRKYGTDINDFLLYPTEGYTRNDNFIDSFQSKYQNFVSKNASPKKDELQLIIKYYAKVEKIIQCDINDINVEEYSIWTKTHVKTYLKNDPAMIWVMRVYKLKNELKIEPAMGMKYSKTKIKLDPTELTPIIDNQNFMKIEKEINNDLNLI